MSTLTNANVSNAQAGNIFNNVNSTITTTANPYIYNGLGQGAWTTTTSSINIPEYKSQYNFKVKFNKRYSILEKYINNISDRKCKVVNNKFEWEPISFTFNNDIQSESEYSIYELFAKQEIELKGDIEIDNFNSQGQVISKWVLVENKILSINFGGYSNNTITLGGGFYNNHITLNIQPKCCLFYPITPQ